MPTPSGSGPTSASTANRWAFSPATGGGMMPRGKKERGRPVTRRRPPCVAAMPEQIAAALFRRPANHQGQFERDRGVECHCAACQRKLHYTEMLYNDGRRASCHRQGPAEGSGSAPV